MTSMKPQSLSEGQPAVPAAAEGLHFPVAERFVSINGEGLHAGCFSAFIRFTGCNLRCNYCDTQWACEPDAPHEELSLQELVAYVVEQDVPCVTLTGGEPLLQEGLPQLVRALLEQTECVVEIETNGACDIRPLVELRYEPGIGHYAWEQLAITLDCKSPSSGMAGKMLAGNYEHLGEGDCVKFVVGSEEDLAAAANVIEQHALFARCQVLFSPIWGQIEPAHIVDYLRERGLKEARVQLQLHKLIWPNEERGV